MRQEYVAKFHSGDQVVTMASLGQIPDAPPGVKLSVNETRMLGVWRRVADVVILRDYEVLIQEFALLPAPGDVSLIELYGRLFNVTPEYAGQSRLPVRLQIIGALEDPVLSSMARERNIEVILYQPAWLDEYLSTLIERKRRAPAQPA